MQNLILKNYTSNEIKNFQSFITSIFYIPFSQGLITTLCTLYNETFNRKILKYLDKWIDYWTLYSTWYALAVLDQNDRLDIMISKVCIAATEKDFLYFDICNILKFIQDWSQKNARNHNAI